mgnify:CR=1 FL=1
MGDVGEAMVHVSDERGKCIGADCVQVEAMMRPVETQEGYPEYSMQRIVCRVRGVYDTAYVEAPSSPECSPWQCFGAC